MTLAMIQNFIREMHDANAYFGRIRILGGEPTMWGPLPQAAKMLYDDLVVPGYIGHLELITNGDNMEKAREVKPWVVKIRVSNEADKQKHHTASMVNTPLSMGYPPADIKPCSQPTFCGIQLSAYGYFPCSAGAGLAKLRNLQKFQRLELPTCVKPRNVVRETWPDLSELCGHCMHALKEEHKIKCGTGMKPGQHALSAPSPEVWEHLGPLLAGKQLDWQLYGAT